MTDQIVPNVSECATARTCASAGAARALYSAAPAQHSRSTPHQRTQPWIAAKAEGGRRAARPTTCHQCGAPTLTGPDADRAALTATVDPQPIDAATELHTLLDGRHTYDLHGSGHCRELHARDTFHIRANPAGTGTWPVLAEHHCQPNSDVTQSDQLALPNLQEQP